jgi:HK97 family phage prohead protease
VRQRPEINRSFPLLDIEIERAGDGRTVTAYAATFGDPYEVGDIHGHYFESINPKAFNRTISRGFSGVAVLYNHGMQLGTTTQPSDRFGVPLGVPLEIRADARGLLTRTRYSKTPLADEVLELIRDGGITSQSFRGPIFQSARPQRHASGLQLIERTELGLRDYGPTPFPVNVGAEMVSVRSTDLLTVDPADLTDDERAELLAALNQSLTPPPAPVNDGTAVSPGDEEAPPPTDPASDPLYLAQANRRRRANS